MKIRYQFLIILFIAISLLIVREDIVRVVDNISMQIRKEKENPVVILEKENILLNKKIETPGALRVANDLLDNNSNIELSKNNIISIVNKYRKENGNLAEVTENAKLNLSALKKLQDMFDRQYFEHVSSDNIGVSDLGDQVGYEYMLIGENLAMGNFKSDQTLVDAWMASLGHRENILNKNYTEIGVAVGKGNFEGHSIWLAVQHFGTPRSLCPAVDQVLYGIINSNQNQIKEMEQNLILRKEMIDKRAIYEGSTYNEQVDKYNNLVSVYNNLLSEIKIKINNYNNQVKVFNDCLNTLNLASSHE